MLIEDKEKQLNSRSPDKSKSLLSLSNQKELDLPKNWNYIQTPMYIEKKYNWGKSLLLISIFVLLIVVSYFGYTIYSSSNQLDDKKIILNIDAPDSVEPGKDFNIKISTANNNKVNVINASLQLEYEKSLSGIGIANIIKSNYNYNTLSNGTVRNEVLTGVKIYGRSGSIVKVHAKLLYKIEGNNGQFYKVVDKEIKILPRQLSIKIEGPKDLDGGEIFTYKVIIKNDSDNDIQQSKISFAFPAEYKTISASSPLNQKDEWELDKINKGEEITNTIKAVQSGINGEQKAIRIKMEEIVDGLPAIISDATYEYSLVYLPLNIYAKLKVDHSTSNIIYDGQEGLLNITWNNSLPESISNMHFEINTNGMTTLVDKSVFPALLDIPAGDKSYIEIPLIGKADMDGNMHIKITAYGDRLQASVSNNKIGSTEMIIKVKK